MSLCFFSLKNLDDDGTAMSRAAPRIFAAAKPALRSRLRIGGAAGGAQDGVEGHDAGLPQLLTPESAMQGVARWKMPQ